MDYLKLLENSFKMETEINHCPPETRFEFLANHIFNFTTYDSDMGELFGQKAVEVCTAINTRKTFEYQETAEGYMWYLIMCNMPFFENKLEWGTSIRGAWWNLHGGDTFEISSCGLWLGGQQIISPIAFNTQQWSEFISAMDMFTNETKAPK